MKTIYEIDEIIMRLWYKSKATLGAGPQQGELNALIDELRAAVFSLDSNLPENRWHSPEHVGKMRMMLREQYICPDCLRHLTGDGMGIPYSEACKCEEKT